jgi:hypothetical protein
MFRKSKTRSNRRVVLGLADVHGGHTLGLLSPEAVLIRDNPRTGQAMEWRPPPTEVQDRLWRIYQQHIRQVIEFAGDDEVIAFHVGDLTWGTVHPNGEIPGITYEEQQDIGLANLLPVATIPTLAVLRLISGTYAHVHDSAEAKVAHRLAARTGKDVDSLHHPRVSIDGVIFDVAHHGPHPGTRDWLRGNVALYYLRDRVYRDRREGKEPARVYLRGHYHEWVPVALYDRWAGRNTRHDLTILPSYSGLTWFARKVTQSMPILTNGLCCYEIVDGRLANIVPFLDSEDLRVEEVL